MQEAKNVIFQMRFPQKLWYLLDLGTDAILWGGTGRTILLNYKVLQNYLQCDHSIFKTTNISSFIRQLNLYGFRKVTSHLQDPLCNSSNPYMHEFIHDNFQYGRPELLKKITRKTWSVKPKPKTFTDHLLYVSPLQKARRALRLALQKAAQDLLVMNSSKSEYGETPDVYSTDREYVELEWLMRKNKENPTPVYELTPPDPIYNVKVEANDKYGDISQESLMDFSSDASQQNNNFPTQFLNMPELDEPSEGNSGVELLAEFNIEREAGQSMISKSSENHPDCNSLNCVLPSVSNEHIEDMSMLEKNNEEMNYNSEWDQMFSDMIMANKTSNQEGVSNFRELYSQISQTIDLLNS